MDGGAATGSEEGAEQERVAASEVRLATRPKLDVHGSNDAWARSVVGLPRVTVTVAVLKKLPLDHRTGFLLSLMDGTLDLETIIELSAMDHDEALALVRDLYESQIIAFESLNPP
jgi:hypothetical protein